MPAYDPKKVVGGAVLALQMVLSSVAFAMTLQEFKDLPGPKQDRILGELISKQLDTKKITSPAKAQCLDDQFFKVSTNTLRIPDGSFYIGQQIEKSYKRDPNGRHVEDLVSRAIDRIASEVCSPTQQGK